MERPVAAETNSNHRERVARVTIFKPVRCNKCGGRREKYDSGEKKGGRICHTDFGGAVHC